MMEKIRFDLHTLGGESEYIQRRYLSLLLQMAACDGDIVKEEMVYIKKIAGVARISDKDLEPLEYEDFDIILEALKYDFVTHEVAYACFCDMFVLAMEDGDLNEKEVNFIGALAEEMELEESLFEYLYRVSQAVSKGSENAYLIAVLSRHKEVPFEQFQFFFGDIDNTHTRKCVKEMLTVGRKLEELKKRIRKVNFKNARSIAKVFPDDGFLEEVGDALNMVTDLRLDLEEETCAYMEITDDGSWEIEYLLDEISDSLDTLMAHSLEAVLAEDGDWMDDFDSMDFAEDADQIVEHIDGVMAYLEGFQHYEEIRKKMGV